MNYIRPVDVFRNKIVFDTLEESSYVDNNELNYEIKNAISYCIYKSNEFSILKKNEKNDLYEKCLTLIPDAKKIIINYRSFKIKIFIK